MEFLVEEFLKNNFCIEINFQDENVKVYDIFENFFINYNVIHNNIQFEEYEKNKFECVNKKQLNCIFENFLELKNNKYSVLYKK